MPTPGRCYGKVAQALHWLVAALVVTQFALAYSAARLPLGIERLILMARHKSVGMTILMLSIVRLAWRIKNPPPPLPGSIRPVERRLARYSHRAFYVLLFAMPLSGWLMSSAKNYSVSWFNLVTWPDLIGKSDIAFVWLRGLHDTLSFVLLALAIVHVLAAFRHQFWLKDDVLQGMLPFGKTRTLP
jgi:cytochrome b561